MNEVKVSTLIDRVISIAKHNSDKELLHWAYLESRGYTISNKYMTDNDVVPVYREIPVEHQDQYNRPIIFTDPKLRDINNTRIRHSVSELEDYSIKQGTLSVKDPTILNIINKNFDIQATHYIITPSSLKCVLNSIKQEALERAEKYIGSESLLGEVFSLTSKNHDQKIENSIFLSYSFTPKEKELIKGFEELLKSSGFTVLTGEKNPIGSISKSIINKIQKAERFIVIMTKRDKKENGKYTTSSWLLEEKGIAIANGKPCIIFVENEIDEKDIGGMQGDDQRLHFTRNNFSSKIDLAIKMLKGEIE